MVQRKIPVSSVVFRELYPFGPRESEPRSWPQHVRDNLAVEARAETATFYGGERTYEAKFPGLDYNYLPHRRRLGRFLHHNELFKAMDRLGLTKWEIYELCNWDCTLYAKEKYVREHPSLRGVRDTTGEDIPTWEQVHGPDARSLEIAEEGEEGDAETEGEFEEEGGIETDKEDVEMEGADELAVEQPGESGLYVYCPLGVRVWACL